MFTSHRCGFALDIQFSLMAVGVLFTFKWGGKSFGRPGFMDLLHHAQTEARLLGGSLVKKARAVLPVCQNIRSRLSRSSDVSFTASRLFTALLSMSCGCLLRRTLNVLICIVVRAVSSFFTWAVSSSIGMLISASVVVAVFECPVSGGMDHTFLVRLVLTYPLCLFGSPKNSLATWASMAHPVMCGEDIIRHGCLPLSITIASV